MDTIKALNDYIEKIKRNGLVYNVSKRLNPLTNPEGRNALRGIGIKKEKENEN